MFGQLPFIPFIHSAQDVVFAFFVVCRVTGIFLISPILANQNLKGPARAFLILMTSAMMAMTFYPSYLGPEAKYPVSLLDPQGEMGLLMLALVSAKELAVGFILGFIFTFITEAILLAGQMVGVVIGFSIAEIIDPVSGTSQSMISNIYIIAATLIMLTLDLHHVFFRICAESFGMIPLGHYHFPPELLDDVSQGSARLFSYSLQYAAIPYIILLLVTLGLGYMAKVMPEMNIFMVGFPLRIFIGYYGLIFSITYFPLLIQKSFVEYINLAGNIMKKMGTGM